MTRALVLLGFLTFLGPLSFVRCQLECGGGPVPIPAEDNFQLFVLPLEAGAASSFPTVSRAQVVSNLGVDFLQPETIQELAEFSNSFSQLPFSALAPISSSICNIPLSEACRIQACGCPSENTGRKLLQCFPVFGCRATPVGGSRNLRFEEMMVGLCIRGTCSLFSITRLRMENFQIVLDLACPGTTAGGPLMLNLPPAPPTPPAPPSGQPQRAASDNGNSGSRTRGPNRNGESLSG